MRKLLWLLLLLAACNHLPTAPKMECREIQIDTIVLGREKPVVVIQARPKCSLKR